MNAAQYAEEWSVKSGRSSREIYVPIALREEIPMHHCTECKDEFDPIEGRIPSDDPADQSNFCSDRCYEKFHDRIDFEESYNQARYSGAPVLP